MIVCCHQPDLFPWIGFFKKLYNSDVWIVLDHVINNPKNQKNWIRRVKLEVNGSSKWFSLPVVKSISNHGKGYPIFDWKYDISTHHWDERRDMIINNFRKYKYFSDIEPLLIDFFSKNSDSLSDKNQTFIIKILKMFGKEIHIVKSSKFNLSSFGTQMLIDCILKVKGNVYLSGDGADGYQDENLFKKNKIDLKFNNFTPSSYSQQNIIKNFIPGLSILDIICNCGVNFTKDYIKSL